MYVAAPMPERCVIVLDQELPPGLAANAAAVLAVTLGAREPALVGGDLVDADERVHAGLFRAGLPVLKAPRSDLRELRDRAADAGLGVVDLPAFGQQTNDYDEFRAAVARTRAADLEYLGLAVYGERRPVGRLTGNLSLLR
jgi:Protein of unknown function (DUF2000)